MNARSRCKQCKKKKKKASFSKSQWKKVKSERKCIHCVDKMQNKGNKINKSMTKQKQQHHTHACAQEQKQNVTANVVQAETEHKSDLNQNPTPTKIDSNKVRRVLNDSMFYIKLEEIEQLMIENQSYQELATKHEIVCHISKDCVMISGDIESIKIDHGWNMKRRENYLSNLMCQPQIILKALIKVCKSSGVRLEIRIVTIDEFCQSMKAHQTKDHNQARLSINSKLLSKLNGACFTNKNEIESLMIENKGYQASATLTNGGTVVCEVGKDCIRMSGDVARSKPIGTYLIGPVLVTRECWVNNMCGPQIVLKELVKRCRSLKIRLEIRIVAVTRF